MNFDINLVLSKLLEYLIQYGPKLILAFLLIYFGLKIIDKFVKIITNPLDINSDDKTLKTFAKSFLSWTLKIMLIISVSTMIGIQTTSFVAVLGAASLAVGLALQGTLGNFAGGVLCLLLKPYTIGDIISTQGVKGKVKEIQIFNTIIITRNNETAIIPNGSIMNGNIINHSMKGKLRVEVEVVVDSHICFDNLREEIYKQLGTNPDIFHTPKPSIGLSSIDGDTIGITIRVWCEPDSYWDVYFSCLELCKKSIEEI